MYANPRKCTEVTTMTDDNFEKMAKLFGFAPSRALRELLEVVEKQAFAEERYRCIDVAKSMKLEETSQGVLYNGVVENAIYDKK